MFCDSVFMRIYATQLEIDTCSTAKPQPIGYEIDGNITDKKRNTPYNYT